MTIELWRQRPGMAAWLRRSAADWRKAFCLYCYREITAKWVFVQRHAQSRRHARLAAAAGLCQSDPETELVPDTAVVPPSSDTGGADGDGNTSTAPRRWVNHAKYNPSWEQRPELAGWLCRSSARPRYAHCLVCSRDIQPKLAHVRRHGASRRHIRNATKAEEVRVEFRPPGSENEGGTTTAEAESETEETVCGTGDGLPVTADRAQCQSDPETELVPDTAIVPPSAPTPSKSNGGDGDGNTSHTPRRWVNHAKYNPSWEQRPELAGWLCRSSARPRYAHCLVCSRDIQPKLAHVRRHGASRRHIRNATKAEEVRVEFQPPGSEKEGGTATAEAESETGETVCGTGDGLPVTADRSQCQSDPETELVPDTAIVPPSAPTPPKSNGGDGDGNTSHAPRRWVNHAKYNPSWEQRPELAGWLCRSSDRPRYAHCLVCSRDIQPKLAHVRRHGASRRHIRNVTKAEVRVEFQPPGSEKEGGTATAEAESETEETVCGTGDGAGEMADAAGEDGPAADDQRDCSADGPQEEVGGRPAPARRRLTYLSNWESVPELRAWLRRSPWDRRRPFCRWCRREVTAKLAHLRRHARCSLHRRARPPSGYSGVRSVEVGGKKRQVLTRERADAPEEAAADGGTDAVIEGPRQRAELGPFGTCVVCKHPLVIRLNIFRSRTRPSGRLVADMLSSLVLQPLEEGSGDLSVSEICTSCAALLDEADELQARLTAIEKDVRLKFSSPRPLARPATPLLNSADPPENAGTEFVPATADPTHDSESPAAETPAEIGDTATGQPVAFITIGESDREISQTVVRTETLENGDLVIYQEPADLVQSETIDAVSNCSPLLDEDMPQDVVAEPPSDDSQSAPEPRAPPVRRRRRRRRSFDCALCRSSFPTSAALKRHWAAEHPHELQQCPLCPRRYLYTSSLKQHVRTHQPRRYTCEQCGKQFTAACDLKKHAIFAHSDVRKHQCGTCGRAFKLAWILSRHMRLVHDVTVK
ncbi:Zinc finger protein CKR1 [Amphibalanus amphitrite]|uniref:Zinc finger protein CKR1 n=1 Tax=Amphibalanus amphitrite TaxID=1232801 RepID=A0A6A4VI53_AMPAM|nr:Zinc finger protein CKR1 [Amphibalanus amphitrite]